MEPKNIMDESGLVDGSTGGGSGGDFIKIGVGQEIEGRVKDLSVREQPSHISGKTTSTNLWVNLTNDNGEEACILSADLSINEKTGKIPAFGGGLANLLADKVDGKYVLKPSMLDAKIRIAKAGGVGKDSGLPYHYLRYQILEQPNKQ